MKKTEFCPICFVTVLPVVKQRLMPLIPYLNCSHLHAFPQVPQQRDLNWVSWQSLSCFTFSQYLVVSLHSMFSQGVMLQRCQFAGLGLQEQ